MKKKIVLVGPTYPYRGGISHYSSVYANELAKQNQVLLVSYSYYIPSIFHKEKPIDKKSKIRPNCRVIYSINTMSPLTWITTAKKIDEFNPDKVIFQWISPFFSLPFRTISSLIKCEEIIFLCHTILQPEKTFLDMPLTKFAFKKATLLLVHSKEDENYLKDIVPLVKVKKIKHPDYDFFYKKIDKKIAQKKLNVKGKVLLFFGLVRKYKGLIYLLRALALSRNKDISLIIAGKFIESYKKYEKFISEHRLTNVKIVNKYIPDDEVALYFSACNAVITPYISGSESGVIHIANVFNIKIITTDVGSFSEAAGGNAIVVPPKNVEKLADAIVSV